MREEIKFDHSFVESIPKEIEDGILYVSMRFATAIHKCACGCGEQVVTPFAPTDWKFMFDGEVVSLTPSIGNWSFNCRSHYWIKNGKIVWAESWSDQRVQAGRNRDRKVKSEHYKEADKGRIWEKARRYIVSKLGW